MVDETQGWIVGPGRAHPAHRRRRQDLDAAGVERRRTRIPTVRTSAPTCSRSTRSTPTRRWRSATVRCSRRPRDGGKTWTATKVKMELDTSGGESLAAADPIFYDVKFTDAQHGWIVGEFGKIMHTRRRRQDVEGAGEERCSRGTGFFDLLDLPTLFGIYAADGAARGGIGPRGAHRAARPTAASAGRTTRSTPARSRCSDPLYEVTELPTARGGASARRARSIGREPARRGVDAGQDRPGRAHLAARHRLLRSAERLDGGRLRPDLPHHGRRQDLAAVQG